MSLFCLRQVADTFTLTPPKIERHFGISGGHIHHIDNCFGFDQRFPCATPVPGLYSASAGVCPACMRLRGFSMIIGACMAGHGDPLLLGTALPRRLNSHGAPLRNQMHIWPQSPCVFFHERNVMRSCGRAGCGAGCHPAGSVVGCAGHNAAAQAVRDLGLKPCWATA